MAKWKYFNILTFNIPFKIIYFCEVHTCSWIWSDMRSLYCIFGLTNHYIKSHLSVKSWYSYFGLFIWMKFTYGLKRCESWKLRLEWRVTPWWQHYDTLPAGFDRVPPRHVTALSCVSNPSQHTRTHTQLTHTHTISPWGHHSPVIPRCLVDQSGAVSWDTVSHI